MKRILESSMLEKALASFVAIFLGFLISFFIMLIIRPARADDGIRIILTQGFSNLDQMGRFLQRSAPLILTGLSVAFAFKTGLFNIGATGQFTVGAFTAVYIGMKWTHLGSIHWVVAVLGAALAGALWALIPGLLKAYRNVHEVVSTIMMNYIGMFTVYILMSSADMVHQNGSHAKSVLASARIPKFGLDNIFPTNILNGGIFISIGAAILIFILLYKTTLGFQLRAVGFNRDAAKYAGVNDKRNIVYSMLIAGTLAGLAGAVTYLTRFDLDLPHGTTLLPQGFDGIAVALLGMSHPLGTLFAGLFFGYINTASTRLNLYFSMEIIRVILSAIVYFSALSLFFQKRVRGWINKLLIKKEKGGVSHDA